MQKSLQTIQQVAKQFNVSTRTLRYYEELGLLTPIRSETKQRFYPKREVAKLKLIFRGKRYGFILDEIKEMVLLFNYDQTGKKQLERTLQYGNQKLQEIDERIAELNEIRIEILQLQEMFTDRLMTLKGE
ncbi:MerR family transcriptional regulator [Solibacillus sp. CAU 1738]|uniref:MerR family transcriptional regulator n=1 Tax=Solibacillus sp. CAU 1738 TaxID=3140363 RepID=UPI00326188A9